MVTRHLHLVLGRTEVPAPLPKAALSWAVFADATYDGLLVIPFPTLIGPIFILIGMTFKRREITQEKSVLSCSKNGKHCKTKLRPFCLSS